MKTNTFKLKVIGLIIFVFGFFLTQAQNKSFLSYEKQEIVLNDFKADGFILDIGGGGEGVIGQLKGNQVISIDLYKDELIEAPSTNLKIVMDARDLKFLDCSFNTVVIFYTMMYIKGKDHEKIFQEVKRVLKNGGKLLIWDVNLPVSKDTTKKGAYFPFKFKLPNKDINTSYGASLPKDICHDIYYYIELAKKEGFSVIQKEIKNQSFFLELQREPLKILRPITDTLSILIEKRGIQEALKEYQLIKKNNQNAYLINPKIFEKLAISFYMAGKIKESVEIVKLMINEFNMNEEMICAYGNEYLSDNKSNEALELFQLGIQKYPQSAKTYECIGDVYVQQGKKSFAKEYFEKSLQMNSKNKSAENKLKQL